VQFKYNKTKYKDQQEDEMYIRLAQKANAILYKHKVTQFPIPIEVIEELLHDEDIKVIIRENLNHGCIIGDSLLMGKCEHTEQRYKLSHEYLHVMEHPGNYFTKDRTTIAKNEAQAHAFAAYLLMPIGIFEDSLKYINNDYKLAEEYGVSLNLLAYRKELTKSLLESGQYHLLKKVNFFNF